MTMPEVARCPDGHYRRVIYGLSPYIANYLSKLPSMVSVWKYAASRTSIAFTMSEMKYVMSIVHFSPNALTN
jgi:hypothetical protein